MSQCDLQQWKNQKWNIIYSTTTDATAKVSRGIYHIRPILQKLHFAKNRIELIDSAYANALLLKAPLSLHLITVFCAQEIHGGAKAWLWHAHLSASLRGVPHAIQRLESWSADFDQNRIFL